MLDETRGGIPIYAGNAIGFDEWVFRIEAKLHGAEAIKTTKPEILAELGSRVIEGLRGDALRISMDMGVPEVCKTGGVRKLIERIDDYVKPLRREEAQALYREGNKPDGLMARATGESIIAYTDRRKRWWTKLRKLDEKIQCSDELLASMMLDQAKFNRIERNLVLTSVNNQYDFDLLAVAMREQHPNLHSAERGKGGGGPSHPGKGRGFRKGKKGHGKAYAHVADATDVDTNETYQMSTEDDYQYSIDAEAAADYPDRAQAYQAVCYTAAAAATW